MRGLTPLLYPRTFTDAKGHTVALAAKPMRIASTVLGIDENLVDLVVLSRIAALTEIAKKMPDVSNIADRVPAEKATMRTAGGDRRTARLRADGHLHGVDR